MTELTPLFRMTIGARIFLGFSAIMALLVAQAMVGNLGFDAAVEQFGQYNAATERVRRMLRIERNVIDLQRVALAYTYSGYDGVADRAKELQRRLQRQVTEALAQNSDAPTAETLEQMRHHLKLYFDNFDAAIEERTEQERMIKRLKSLSDWAAGVIDKARHDARVRDNSAAQTLAEQAQTQLLTVQKDALLFLRSPTSTLVEQTKLELNALTSVLRRLQSALNTHAPTAPSENAIHLMSTQLEQAFFAMVRATRAYMHLVYVVMGGEAAEIAYHARQLKELALSDQSRVETALRTGVGKSQSYTEFATIAALLLGLSLAWWISRNIAEPVRRMTLALTNLARGRQDTQIPGKGRSDEIGAMAMAADVFKEKAYALENASRYKSEFLANMSHELRTPLNSLLVLSKALGENPQGNLHTDQVEALNVIYESGSDLLHLINDILDLSKVEAGRMELYIESKPFDDLTGALERLFRPMATQKGLSLEISVSENAPPIIATDWGKAEQIVRNFLSNAIKFTSHGGVTVRIARPPRNQLFLNADLSHADCVAISVADSGIGIPDDKREQIFEACHQADGSTSRKFGGTGLGLSISRRFADLLNGEIQVESHEGKGSTFTLFLPIHLKRRESTPIRLSNQRQHSRASEAPLFQDLSRTLLLVDDDRRNLFAMKSLLGARVGRILSAQNGVQALELLDEHPDIDLVLMDIMMPEMNGFEAMERIRRQQRFAKLPIIALTAKAMPGDRELCLAAGATEYLPKPVDNDALMQLLGELLGKTKPALPSAQFSTSGHATLPKIQALVDPPQEGRPLEIEPPLCSGPLTVLVVDDDMRNTFSLAHALQDKATCVLMARDGEKALQAIEQNPDIDIILMDVMMPNMDGIEATRRIRSLMTRRQPPIIALTARNEESDRQACLQAGANDYLSKPVELRTLFDKLRFWIGANQQNLAETNQNDASSDS
ncbi:response regulator [Magnetofaba australis]|uniref:histidine kinase n=1 Tax=Magnetofaba australis IT-1 TaxID=1434232 RepID=A0A1Y2K4S1_9PROT|nr:response regulator [Magnetofaba australis]OSM04226.1 putative periplasmic sensor hybrid histidine kinase [Magnetofaba australis IT-1]